MKSMLFYDLFDKVKNVKDPLGAGALFATAREMYGLEHVLYAKINCSAQTHDNCHIQGTYTKEWLQHYFDNDYLSLDPVALLGFATTTPFDWSNLPRHSEKARQVFEESIEFGLGNRGLTIPIASSCGARAIFNINTDASNREWPLRRPELMRDFHIISHFFDNSVTQKMDGQSTARGADLTYRQLECLKWAASGKSTWETSVILALSERTVRFHLDQARQKLNCTTKIQAVAKAVAIDLINIS